MHAFWDSVTFGISFYMRPELFSYQGRIIFIIEVVSHFSTANPFEIFTGRITFDLAIEGGVCFEL